MGLSKFVERSSVRTLALASCSIAALAASPALAQSTPSDGAVTPMYVNISPFYGNISPFYGNISAFYGNISPFYGNISPFYGNISAFWGSTTPFTPTTDASMAKFYGPNYDGFWGGGKADPYTNNPSPYVKYSSIAGFWTSESASWSTVQSAWTAARSSGDYSTVASLLQTNILNPASKFWGPAVTAGGAGGPGGTFATAFSNSLLAKAGVTLNSDGTINAASLASVSPTAEGMLFLNFYDGLMSYSGTGHVDWWMGGAHWSPALAASEGGVGPGGVPVTVGMLDFTVTNSVKSAKGSLYQYGSNVFNDGHGAAVGSLIMGSIDGSGIMGVMPAGGAKVIDYDPYDASGTTNWTDVGTGIQVLAYSTFSRVGAPVGVLNASLGVTGWTLNPGWNTALASGAAYGHNLVIAAGNDGIVQTSNVPWNFSVNPDIIIVGSVGVDGTISNFSNRPGEACLINTFSTSTNCVESDKLKYRFIVAPGELILVSDGSGGVSRQSGTSLAAPLVSGAIAMLQARWPWLASYSAETAEIILQSATPLGTHPGADPIYGVGELNIQASQSPLNWGAMQYFPVSGLSVGSPVSVTGLVNQASTGSLGGLGGLGLGLSTSKLFMIALEPIGRTFRDFEIPLSSSLVGQSVIRPLGTQMFQSYLTKDLQTWIAGGSKLASDQRGPDAVDNFGPYSGDVGSVMGLDVRMRMAPNAPAFGYKPSNVAVATDVEMVGDKFRVRFGYGNGAPALDDFGGFADQSDHDVQRGGANPLVGLASGGAFVDWRQSPIRGLVVHAGVTQRTDTRDLSLFGVSNLASRAGVYSAGAANVGVDVSPTNYLTIHASMTRLHEDAALLGMQSLDASALGKGATTTGATLGFDLGLGHDLTFSASGTSANTRTSADQSLRTGPNGLQSSAGEIALSKANLFASDDRVRLTVSRSLKVDAGQIEHSYYGVVDRQTGALGVMNQTVSAVAGRSPVSAELMYGRLLPKDSSEVSVFLRGEANTDTPSTAPYNYLVGGKYRFTF